VSGWHAVNRLRCEICGIFAADPFGSGGAYESASRGHCQVCARWAVGELHRLARRHDADRSPHCLGLGELADLFLGDGAIFWDEMCRLPPGVDWSREWQQARALVMSKGGSVHGV